jgi:hypothetical protein
MLLLMMIIVVVVVGARCVMGLWKPLETTDVACT